MTTELLKRRLVMFTGKGGVGKTTVATSFALHAASTGSKTLFMQINAKERVSSMLGLDNIGTDIVEIDENLYAVNATPKAAMREYALMTLRVKVIYRAVFENKIIQAFLRAIPGINELVMLGKAYFHAAVEEEHGKPKWDLVVVDAPATGHGIFFLQIPSVITSILNSGPMYNEAERMLSLIRDPERTSVNIVTLAEELPVNESKMLFDTATDELQIPIDYVIVNRVLEPRFSENEAEIFESAEPTGDAIVDGLIDAARFRNKRVALQKKYIDELETLIPRPKIEIPFRFKTIIQRPELNEFGEIMAKHTGAQ